MGDAGAGGQLYALAVFASTAKQSVILSPFPHHHTGENRYPGIQGNQLYPQIPKYFVPLVKGEAEEDLLRAEKDLPGRRRIRE